MGPLRVWRFRVNNPSRMYYYKATLQYDGTNFAGFQWQKDAPTVQNILNISLKKLLTGKVTTMGASRTDSGVHAFEQVVKITTEKSLHFENILSLLNRELPTSIRCLAINSAASDFKPASDTTSKEYRYLFTNKAEFSSLERKYIANIANPLNLAAMMKCAQAINGTHDFCNFVSTGSNVKTTVRSVSSCDLSEINPHHLLGHTELFQIPQELKSCYQFKIEANGFLKQMIRHLIRGLWMVGSGKITTEEFLTLLDGPKVNKQLWRVAPANGLYLYRINY